VNDIVLGNYYRNGAATAGTPACGGRIATARAVDFAITFPGKRTDIVGALGLWVFTAFTFVLILVLFGIMIIDLSRQKKLADMKADFINNMTHELQTPITNISIASEVLRTAADHMEGTKALHYANIIHQENQRLKIQVEQVLQTAMMEKGEFELKKNEVNIHSLIEEVIHTFQVRIANRHGQIRSQLEALHPLVYADRFHLANVLYNLLDNAEKYSPAEPEITITTKNKDNGVLIAIADKGIGISNEVQPYVFDKFYRAPSGNVHDVKGFGLGLTYVRRIVDAHQGNVSLWSELSKGSRFELYFHNC
jgi:two-component system phosphate regulon sensor histidine kinase PhoR